MQTTVYKCCLHHYVRYLTTFPQPFCEYVCMPKNTTAEDTNRKYVAAVIDASDVLPGVESFEALRPEQLSVLAGGVDAATYLVRSGEGQAIIKISDHDIESEVEALEAWRRHRVRVPEVLATGVVPQTASRKKLKYLIQKAILTKHGRLVETCADYLVTSPEQSRIVGRLLGIELTKMHQAIAPRSFGEYADAAGNTAAYQSWNAYMLGYLQLHAKYLVELGVDENDVQKIETYIKNCNFVVRGRYLHGDFSIRNAAVKSYEPLKVSIFDPNPIVGDPTWDIAVLFNNYEFHKRRMQYDNVQVDLYNRDKQLLTGFKQGYNRKIHDENLWVAQLMQAILQAQYTAEKVKSKKLDAIDLKVRTDFIVELARRMAGAVQQ